MEVESLFDDVQDHLESELRPTDVEVKRADETLVFWKGSERVGLEVPRNDVEKLYHYFDEETFHEDKTVERVISKVKQDSFHYLVLKYL